MSTISSLINAYCVCTQASWFDVWCLFLASHAPYKWDYWPHDDVRAECRFVGLTNLGATCYLASTIQQLYMIPEARQAVFTAKVSSYYKLSFINIYKTQFINCKTFIFSSPVLLLCVYTRYIPLAHPCSYYYVLSPRILYCTSYVFCTFYSIAHFTLYFFFFLPYICSCVVLLLFLIFFALSTERT